MAAYTLDRIIGRCRKDGDCLIWAGKMHTSNGCPCAQEYVNGKDQYVNVRRRAYELYHGVTLTRSQLVSARCGNRLCLSKKCLHIITASERSAKARADMTAAAKMVFSMRQSKAQQAKRGKFTPELVRAIRESEKGPYVIAKELGVSGAVASRIKRGVSWRDYEAITLFSGLAANDMLRRA